jgi:hypothetical protein
VLRNYHIICSKSASARQEKSVPGSFFTDFLNSRTTGRKTAISDNLLYILFFIVFNIVEIADLVYNI